MRMLRRLILINLLAALVLASAAFFVQAAGQDQTPSQSRSGNAAWIDHRWVSSIPSRSAVTMLCNRLRDHQVGTIYAHVGPADASGQIAAARAPYAGQFAGAMHALCPGTRVLAWIGQTLPSWHGLLNLQDSTVRNGLVQTANRFVGLGFDGVQYDLEPVPDGDAAFLSLLGQTRAALGRHWLAVAGPAVQPSTAIARQPHLKLPLPPWSSAYYARIAALADEIDPMLYETGLQSGAAYSSFVADQVRTLSADLLVQVLRPGLPTFPGRSASFDDRVENIRNGVTGLAHAFTAQSRPASLSGIAIYPLWQMNSAGWAALDAWQGN